MTHRCLRLDHLSGSNNLAKYIKHALFLSFVTSDEKHSCDESGNTVHDGFGVIYIIRYREPCLFKICLYEQEAPNDGRKEERFHLAFVTMK